MAVSEDALGEILAKGALRLWVQNTSGSARGWPLVPARSHPAPSFGHVAIGAVRPRGLALMANKRYTPARR